MIIYGSSICPKCKKAHYALVVTSDGVVPPPKLTVNCQCQLPVIPVDLLYSGNQATPEYLNKVECSGDKL